MMSAQRKIIKQGKRNGSRKGVSILDVVVLRGCRSGKDLANQCKDLGFSLSKMGSYHRAWTKE